MDDPIRIMLDGERLELKPWRHGCWTDDWHPVERCDRETSTGYPDCFYHDQSARIAGDNAVVAWVEETKRNGGELDVYAWDPAEGDHVEVLTSRRVRFRCGSHARSVNIRSLRHAKDAADKSMLANIRRHEEQDDD